MTLGTVLVFAALAFGYAALLPARWRGWALLVVSVVAVYVLQPALPIRYSAYTLPTAMLGLIVISWWLTRNLQNGNVNAGAVTQFEELPEPPLQQPSSPNDVGAQHAAPLQPPSDSPSPTRAGRGGWGVRGLTHDDLLTLAVLIALILAVSFLRFIDGDYRLVASTPPAPLSVIVALMIVAVAGAALRLVLRVVALRQALTGMILLIAAIFVIFKTEPLASELSRALRFQTGQDTSLASIVDLGWVGFSYVAFRLIHTLRDRQTGILPALSLREYVTYVIFFPAFTAGPIDRAERFVEDYRALPQLDGLDASRFVLGVTRILIGLFKKFVIADILALGLALNPVNVGQVDSALGMWVLLYGYALRLYFDFSGYTDIAIGIGILYGITLPENFSRPYLRTTLTSFWQSWHITLSNWARFYVFSPLSRALLTRKPKPSSTIIVLLAQIATMVVIGLWHGVALNFLLWGLWHGVGLFVHKQWSDRTRRWYRALNDKPARKRVWSGFSWFVTFHYVVLGWVWFALPDLDQSLRTFGVLFGGGR
jgi:alginate O-acetyltransferase complex protein AlgI